MRSPHNPILSYQYNNKERKEKQKESLIYIITGVPVATVGINNSINAALLAVRILGAFDPSIQRKVEAYAEAARSENMELKGTKMQELGWEKYFAQM